MRRTPEGTKTPPQHALERVLQGAVWIKDKEGNYETILPHGSPYLRNLTAIAIIQNAYSYALPQYEWVDEGAARHIKISKQFADEHHYSPMLLAFDEHALPAHERPLTHAMLLLLNSNWSADTSITDSAQPLHTASLPIGELARGVYAYLRHALGKYPEDRALIAWNKALVLNPDEKREAVHLHFSPALSEALFGGDFKQLMEWRRSLDPFLGKKEAEQPPYIHVATEFAPLREMLAASAALAAPPTPRVREVRTPARVVEPKQLKLDF